MFSRRGGIPMVVCAILALGGVRAQPWCEMVFKDVASTADAVVLAQLSQSSDGPREVRLVEVIRSRRPDPVLLVVPAQLRVYDIEDGDHALLALDRQGRLIRTAGLGACSATSVLPIRKGKLRSKDRVDFDSRNGSLTLDQLKDALREPDRDRAQGAEPATSGWISPEMPSSRP